MRLLKIRSFRRSAVLCLAVGLGWGANPALRAQTDLAAVRAQAKKGVPAALTALGTAYASGQGVPQDYAKALQYYKQAAAANDALAQYNIGLLYETGRGVPQDLPGAVGFYLQAAKQGIVQAEFNLANMYADGRGVAPDLFEAALWYRQAAEKGLAEAQFNLGLAYELGHGVVKNPDQARTWYQAADAQGFAKAHERLASFAPPGTVARTVQGVPVGSAIPDDRAAVLDTELTKVRLENARSIEALQKEKAALQTRLQVAEAAMKDALSAPAAADLRRQVARLEADNAGLNQELKRSMIELSRLSGQLAAAQSCLCWRRSKGDSACSVAALEARNRGCRWAKNSRTRGSPAISLQGRLLDTETNIWSPLWRKPNRQARRRSSAAE